VIDLKLLRASPERVRAALARRGDPGISKLLDELEALDMKRRALTGQLDQLKAERNEAAKADARLMKDQGELPPGVREQRKQMGERIAGLEAALKTVEFELEQKALFVPNLPLPELPHQGRLGGVGLGHHQQTGRVSVQPMHDAGSAHPGDRTQRLLAPRRASQQGVDEGPGGVAGGWAPAWTP